MISIDYNNAELKSLILDGKSSLYNDVSKKRGFMQALQGFPYLLRILSSTGDLLLYKQYDYKQCVNVSYVHINGSNTQRRLLFSEHDHGTSITINDLIK